jgi:hypothetical protein
MEKKRCKVVMLPTDKTNGTLWKTTIGQLIHTHLSGEYKEKYQPFNLYITSDDKIEEDDWVIETSNSNALEQFADYSLNQKSMGCKKIIATTDSELKLSYDGKTPISKDWNGKQLPQIPQNSSKNTVVKEELMKLMWSMKNTMMVILSMMVRLMHLLRY